MTERRQNFKGAGAGFTGLGVAFPPIAIVRQTAFAGIGLAFSGVGSVLLAKSRQGG